MHPLTRIALSISVVAAAVGAVPAHARTDRIGTLEVGGHFLRRGPVIERAEGGGCSASNPCFEYVFAVAAGGHRLRAAIDVPDRADRFALELDGPGGRLAEARNNSYGSYSMEVFVRDPRPGSYRLRVVPLEVDNSPFRVRAKLEGRRPRPRGWLRPNLRVIPPHDFTFTAPVTGLNTIGNDGANPPLGAAGVYPMSCTFDEMAELGALRCLRFSAGLENAGDGPLLLRFAPLRDAATEPTMYQVIHHADGSTREREAGTYEYHATHAHYHYTDFATYQLFEVVDPDTGRLRRIGRGTKSGFCTVDQRLADFHRFYQDPRGSVDSNCFSPSNATMGLSTGWGDVYKWQRSGQFVEFSDAGDGLYVVRAIADASRRLEETDRSDNAGYALIRVEGDEVEVLERGRGRDPWDPGKQVLRW